MGDGGGGVGGEGEADSFGAYQPVSTATARGDRNGESNDRPEIPDKEPEEIGKGNQMTALRFQTGGQRR